ncbi:DUF456 domain-containing protein [Wenzhouxiangella sp. XN24]|uniref:DUF456 family protein n=1 Tax=Wenzhouxiangella sp. XN24 TaxID=2713569 RepID=UPI0013ECA2DD|nr:DUF456 domain-containing protein [Wenzhouxiangella sp. XN24]
MTALLLVLAGLLVIAGLVGMVSPALPGPLLLFAGLWMAAWAEGFAHVGAGTVIALGVMAALAMILDSVAGAFGARRYGASGRAMLGAALGGIVGIFFGLPGLLLGPFIGALLGELSLRRDLPTASRAGWGATVGMLLGIAAKMALGIAMLGLFVMMRLF